MAEAVGLAPFVCRQPEGPLARYRPPELGDAAAEFVSQLTAPGDLVLDLFCRGGGVVRAVVQLGRRALGIGINPIGLLIAALELRPPPSAQALSAAFTRLTEMPKGDQPLRRHLNDLYRARCPACGADGLAEWFAWDREANYPYAKAVRCPRCGDVQEGPTDEEDIAGARRYPAKGLPYHYALGRVAPPDHPARDRAAELVDLYTPRNLAALMDVAIRLEGLEAEPSIRAALQGLLVGAFDRGASLDPHGEERKRPRVLRPPARFLERNVWLLLEQGLEQAMAWAERAPSPCRRAEGLDDLLGAAEAAYLLVPSAAREVGNLVPRHTVALVLADPPRPDGVFWALCALWSGWLWDSPAAHAMRPFLRRRRFDWEWHRRALQGGLAAAAEVLRPDGHLVTLFADPEPALLESVCVAASAAGYEIVGWGAEETAGIHLVWRRSGRSIAPADPKAVAEEMIPMARALAEECLRGRSEPTPRTTLHAAVLAGLARQSHLARVATPVARPETPGEEGPEPPLALTTRAVQAALAELPLKEEGPQRRVWFAREPTASGEPLADRVERSVLEAFRSEPTWSDGELMRRVYRAFAGPLTPDLGLVRACIESYGRWRDGGWRLREEDDPQCRAGEVKTLTGSLRQLGRRLGFEVSKGRGWDVRWREGGRDVYLFVVTTTAMLGCHLLSGPTVPEGACPCLVFPGGRAELLAYKLRRDARLSRVAAEEGWQFIKFRHLRRLIAEGLDRRLFEAVLGLDPIVEQEGVQIPLVMGGDP